MIDYTNKALLDELKASLNENIKLKTIIEGLTEEILELKGLIREAGLGDIDEEKVTTKDGFVIEHFDPEITNMIKPSKRLKEIEEVITVEESTRKAR